MRKHKRLSLAVVDMLDDIHNRCSCIPVEQIDHMVIKNMSSYMGITEIQLFDIVEEIRSNT